MKKYRVNVNGTDYEITLEALKDGEDFAPKAEPAKAEVKEAPKATAPVAGGEKVCAPMPGSILKVNVKNGDVVKAGTVLFVLEAMKMENEIQAPVDGTVAGVSVSQGAAAKTGDVLCVIA